MQNLQGKQYKAFDKLMLYYLMQKYNNDFASAVLLVLLLA
jgi:hypothetical protein